MATWQLQEAKAHFSNVVRNALAKGPQTVTLRGEPVAVVISSADYKKLTKPKPSFITFMRQSPLRGLKIKFSRNKSLTRDINL